MSTPTNRHLPNVPSAADIAAGGLDMTVMQITLLTKVEDLTLYMLEQDALIKDLTAQVAANTGRAARVAMIEARK